MQWKVSLNSLITWNTLRYSWLVIFSFAEFFGRWSVVQTISVERISSEIIIEREVLLKTNCIEKKTIHVWSVFLTHFPSWCSFEVLSHSQSIENRNKLLSSHRHVTVKMNEKVSASNYIEISFTTLSPWLWVRFIGISFIETKFDISQ